jgi:predicted nucleic acid-binding protein
VDILLDANVLLRLSQPGHWHEPVAVAAVRSLHRSHRLVLVPQAIYEYWVVATRPIDVNGLGFDTNFAAQERDRFLSLFRLLRDERAVFELWMDLVALNDVRGPRAHDTRYVAAMQRHSLTHLLTFNDRDFQRYKGITALNPLQVAANKLA